LPNVKRIAASHPLRRKIITFRRFMRASAVFRFLESVPVIVLGAVALGGALLVGCRSTEPAASRMTPAGEQVAVPLGTSEAPFGYHQYVPPRAAGNPKARYPALIFLHGSGERGDGRDDIGQVTRHGPPRLIREGTWDASRPFIVLSPQLSASQARWPVDSLDAFIDYAVDHYRIDPSRIYLTGLSLGGHGTWTYAAAHPERIAAAVPVAGDGGTIEKAGEDVCHLTGVPVWAFHGAADAVVDPSGSIETVRRLRACTPPPQPEPRLTIFRGVGHDAWSPTYDGSGRRVIQNPNFSLYDRDLYGWMLQHSR
jgi:poly(3-hydroxybutyrate) depolymerase